MWQRKAGIFFMAQWKVRIRSIDHVYEKMTFIGIENVTDQKISKTRL